MTKFTPVLGKVKPSEADGFVPSAADLAIASTPLEARLQEVDIETRQLWDDLDS